MAFTLDNPPSSLIHSKASYTYRTDIVESSSYQNVRIRVNVYVHGEIVAIIEQPKGLEDFDLTEILNSICGKLEYNFKSSTKIITPLASGTNLFTGAWVNSGTWASFTSANELSLGGTAHAAIDGYARSAAISLTKGDTIVFLLNAASTNSTGYSYLSVSNNTTYGAGTIYDVFNTTYMFNGLKIGFLHITETVATAYIWLKINAAAGTLAYTMRTFKVSASSMVAYNNPVCYYKVIAQEVYENSSDVTTIGISSLLPSSLFIPAKISNTNLLAYKLSASDKKFLSKSIGIINSVKNFIYNKAYSHIRVLGVSGNGYTPDIYKSIDGGAYTADTFYHAGWFYINIESESYLSSATSKFTFYYRSEASYYSEGHEIELTSKCTPFPVQIEFKGNYGNEFIVLAGRKVKSIMNLFKDKFTNKYGLKLPFGSQIMNSIEVESNFQKEEYFQLLGELINTEKTPELILEANTDYDYDYCAPCEITEDEIITDSENEMVNAKIKVNYYPYNL